jgi:hypothetical protein
MILKQGHKFLLDNKILDIRVILVHKDTHYKSEN